MGWGRDLRYQFGIRLGGQFYTFDVDALLSVYFGKEDVTLKKSLVGHGMVFLELFCKNV